MNSISPTVIAVASLITLNGCGGGGGGSGPTSTEQALAQSSATIASNAPTCPESYKSITLDKSSVAGATFSMQAGDATLSFKAPNSSIRVCFGVSPTPIADGSIYMLSGTYDIKAYPLDTSANFQQLIDRTLTVKFSLAGAPAGTSQVDIVNKAKVFTDAEGGLTPAVQTSISVPGTYSTEKNATIIVAPNNPGRYVVAYKP
jgi:hypothetical protein